MSSKPPLITRYSPSSYTEAKQGVKTPELSPEALVGEELELEDTTKDLVLSERVKVLKIDKKRLPGRRRRHLIKYLDRPGKKWVKLSRRGDKIQNYALVMVNSSPERKKRNRTVTSKGTRTKRRTKHRTKRRTKHRRRTKRR